MSRIMFGPKNMPSGLLHKLKCGNRVLDQLIVEKALKIAECCVMFMGCPVLLVVVCDVHGVSCCCVMFMGCPVLLLCDVHGVSCSVGGGV